MDVAAIGAAAGPVVQATVPGRVLEVDGDALAYSCAGNDDTSAGQAINNLLSRIASAKRRCGAEFVVVLCTGRDSHKGHRYAVARVKPYQGQRKSGRRPKNYEVLRQYLDAGGTRVEAWGHVRIYSDREADDAFAVDGLPEDTVIYTEDKDMQMKPAWHLSWDQEHLVRVPPGAWSIPHHKKLHVYGRKWFWLQMLHGDGADNIPGLPKYINDKGNAALCGPVTATALLADANNEDAARATVFGLYRGFYGEETWRTELLEQAVLLWMRNDKYATWSNVIAPGNPLDFGRDGSQGLWVKALLDIQERVGE